MRATNRFGKGSATMARAPGKRRVYRSRPGTHAGTRAATDSVDGAKCPEAIAALSHPIVSWSYELSISLADARFLFDRATGLIRRGWLSLRTGGLRGSWHRSEEGGGGQECGWMVSIGWSALH